MTPATPYRRPPPRRRSTSDPVTSAAPSSKAALATDQLHKLRALFDAGETSVFLELCGTFRRGTRKCVEAAAIACNEGDTPALERQIHSLKGMASAFGAQRLVRLCDALEIAAHTGDLSALPRALARLEEELHQVERSILRAVEDLDSDSRPRPPSPAPGGVATRGLEATVVLVEDDPVTLRIAEKILSSAGYRLLSFGRPDDFLAHGSVPSTGCVLLDLKMPNFSGLDLQRELTERGSALGVVFLSGSADVRSSVAAMKGGAVDFLLKPIVPEELLAAVGKAVRQSEAAFARCRARAEAEARWAELTPREREVCLLVAKGLLNKQIGAELGMSEATVKIHRARGMKKLGVGSAAELTLLLEHVSAERLGGTES